MSDYQMGLAIATLWQEARGCSEFEQEAVAHVILNRMRLKYLSNGTIAGTVLRKYQFSGWMNDEIARHALMYAATDVLGLSRIWARALADADVTDGAVLYYTPDIPAPDWVEGSVLTLTTPNFLFYKP